MNGVRFPELIRKKLMDSVGDLCSAPHCRVRTAKFDIQTGKKIDIGEAAHIRGTRGPRYDPDQSDSERHDFGNGIWLCRNCHRRVDQNTVLYPVDLLIGWKQKAMEDYGYQLGRPALSYPGLDLRDELRRAKSFLEHQILIIVAFQGMVFYRSRGHNFLVPEEIVPRVFQIARGNVGCSWNNDNEHWCFFPDFHRRQAELIRLLKIISEYPEFSLVYRGERIVDTSHEGRAEELVFLGELASAIFLYYSEWNRVKKYLDSYGAELAD
ncbi:HNH endonuclease [Pseudomonas viridiflava]|uniref:HNH endonuclease n=1 Tax=Pseudomonas viridiflava TaxID=33069 RepID=UPI002EB737C5|nr:HNH endonuclease [Pseudomonas viridiflava]